MEFAKSRPDSTVTEDELTNTATVMSAIITVCDTLSVVASLGFGIMAVSYSMFVCGNVVMMVALALDEPWYILYIHDRPVERLPLEPPHRECLHTEAFAQMALGNRRPNEGKGANPSWMDWLVDWLLSSGLSWRASLTDAPSSR